MRKVILNLLTYIFFILSSCNSQEKKSIYNPKAIDLNNKAAQFITIKKFDSAIIYLNKAIKIDSTYYFAYGNKSNVYCELKDFKKALFVTEKELMIKPDLAEGWAFAGMLNDKLGYRKNAILDYKKSVEIFNIRILDTKKLNYLNSNELNRAISLILMGEENRGRNDLKKLKQKYPENKSLEDFLKISKQDLLNSILNSSYLK